MAARDLPCARPLLVSEIDVRIADALDQIVVPLFVFLGLLFQLGVFDAARRQPPQVFFRFVQNRLEDLFVLHSFLISLCAPLGDIGMQCFNLPVYFRQQIGNFLVFGVILAIGRLDVRETLQQLVLAFEQLVQIVALIRNLRCRQRAGIDHIQLSLSLGPFALCGV